MEIASATLKDILVIKPKVFHDSRGSFFESFQQAKYSKIEAAHGKFIQDNVSISRRGTLRGLHFQNPRGQAKLVSVLEGEVFDVAVDIRIGSPTFAAAYCKILSASDPTQLLIPKGFAHGFYVLSEKAIFSYKCSDFYDVASEKTLLWSDPALKISWPAGLPEVSPKDSVGRTLKDFAEAELPKYLA